ncbi:peptidylprolyl isomerase [Oceanicella actignis]|uniref:Parvulin-like PPIase n=1 Tax=Oceanicella actignis TaxID=1189325 RepID=A0A1M7RYP8_9RHOB|nr:peptidylprolyl isomerase [Oceanicella actignis]SES96644.1 peptidyl-prolyl cis-trans isomerase SurA [Oceanicella actignis]SHN51365.1 peptidyl-prolyl cis-trans isomerase SurA [Oceanicella actignis]
MPFTRLRAALAAALVAAAALAAPGPGPAAQTAGAGAPRAAFQTVAFVNGKAITNYDLDQRMRLLRLTGAARGADEAELRERALDSLIDDALKREAASAAGIRVPAENLDAALAAFARGAGLDPARLDAQLRKAGVSRRALEEMIETQIAWASLIRRDYGPRAEVSEAELDDAIADQGLDRRVVYDLGEIGLPAGKDRDAALARIEELAARINAGEDFAALARRYSRTPSAARGGRMGKVPSDRLPPALADELAQLEPGKVTRPLGVPGGVVLLTVLGREEQKIDLTPEDRERIRQNLLEQRLQRYAEGRLQELRAQAHIERK